MKLLYWILALSGTSFWMVQAAKQAVMVKLGSIAEQVDEDAYVGRDLDRVVPGLADECGIPSYGRVDQLDPSLIKSFKSLNNIKTPQAIVVYKKTAPGKFNTKVLPVIKLQGLGESVQKALQQLS